MSHCCKHRLVHLAFSCPARGPLRLRRSASPIATGTAHTCLPHRRTVARLPLCLVQRLRGLHYEMIGHHCITLLLSVLCYKYQAFHYWAPCFMGMAEFSSIPLAFIDFFKQFPQYRERFPTVNELSRNIFAVLFLTIRGCYWPYSSFWFWKQSLQVLASGVTYTPLGVIYTFLVCNVMMTMLQWYWASLILTALYYLIIGDERHKQA